MQEAMTADNSPIHGKRSGGLLVLIGILWLLLAAALFFYQLVVPSKVEIKWETATEQQTAGFNIFRSNNPDGEFVLINENKLIDSQGSPVSGARYKFIDDEVNPGETYYYVLEEVEYDSTRNRYNDDIFKYDVPVVTWWAVILTAGSAVIGLVILMAGLKESKNQ